MNIIAKQLMESPDMFLVFVYHSCSHIERIRKSSGALFTIHACISNELEIFRDFL